MRAIQDPSGAVKVSLFADQECEAKIDALRDPLQALEELVDIRVLSAQLDRDCPDPNVSRVVACLSRQK